MAAIEPPRITFARLELRARQLETQQRLEEAGEAYDAALKLEPGSQSCAEGRARIAIRLREDSAADHCARALAFHNDYPDRQLRMLKTAAIEIGDAVIPLLEQLIERHPKYPDAHQQLAELRAAFGEADRMTDSYVAALKHYPGNKPLLMSYWTTLARAGRVTEALDSIESHREHFEADPEYALLAVDIANHAGLASRARSLIERLDDSPGALVARGQYGLLTGEIEEAARLLEAVTAQQPDNQMAWALLEPAWRLLGDPRHEWLVGRPPLHKSIELGLTGSQLTEIAKRLRVLHRTRAEPIGQSVRGGTQTEGVLFVRTEPEILMLREALVAAILPHLEGLPPEDLRHPLLRHRNKEFAFDGSWSVRLTAGGYHASHFHPAGVISSACYISLPEELEEDKDQSGWLELGRPIPQLGLDLPPLVTIQPKPGRLILFPSYLFHGTRPFKAGERLTVAFDLVAGHRAK